MTTLDIIKSLCEKEGISIAALEKELGYGNGSLAKAKKIPADRILDISKRFGVSMDFLMTGEENQSEVNHYYINDDARNMAQFMFENPEYKVLFDASRKVKKEDIEFVKEMIDRMSDK